MWPIKTKYYYYFLAAAFVLLLVGSVLRLLTPAAPTPIAPSSLTNSNINNTQSNFSNITFTGTVPALPSQLPIMLAAQSLTESQLLEHLITSFALSPDPDNPEYLINGRDQFLEKNQYTNVFTLALNERVAEDAPRLSQAQLLTLAQSKLNDVLQTTNLQPQVEDVRFVLEAEEQMLKATAETADFVSIPFSYIIEDVPVLYHKHALDPYFVTITAQGAINSIAFSPQLYAFEPTGRQDLISVDEAVANINNNQASIISYGTTSNVPDMDLRSVRDGQLTDVVLEYRVDQQLNLAYPFYHFTGTARDNRGKNIQIDVITPAVVVKPS